MIRAGSVRKRVGEMIDVYFLTYLRGVRHSGVLEHGTLSTMTRCDTIL